MHHRIGQHASHLPGPQQRVGKGLELPAGMARLQRHRAGMAVAQGSQEIPNDNRIEPQAGWQLHQQPAEVLSQAADLRQKGIEQRRSVEQALPVGNSFGQFCRKSEVFRLAVRPAGIGAGLVRPVKRGIDFNCIEACRIALQMGVGGGEFWPQRTRQALARAAHLDSAMR